MTSTWGDMEVTSPKRLWFLSFADTRMRRSALRIKSQARDMQLFDEIVICDEHSLQTTELAPWADRLAPNVRGYGYWCWKPYLIERTLQQMNDGDCLLYCDAGTYLNPNGLPRFYEYLRMLEKTPLGVLAFDSTEYPERPYWERQWVKGDLVHEMGCSGRREILDTPQIAATQILIVRHEKSLRFLKKWNEIWMRDFHLIDDSPSLLPDADDFRQHRHDQSIFSLLYKMQGGVVLPYYEKFSADWRTMGAYPIWSVRDRGTRFFPMMGYIVYSILSFFCPLSQMRHIFREKAEKLYCRRPWLWKIFHSRIGH